MFCADLINIGTRFAPGPWSLDLGPVPPHSSNCLIMGFCKYCMLISRVCMVQYYLWYDRR